MDYATAVRIAAQSAEYGYTRANVYTRVNDGTVYVLARNPAGHWERWFTRAQYVADSMPHYLTTFAARNQPSATYDRWAMAALTDTTATRIADAYAEAAATRETRPADRSAGPRGWTLAND